VGQLQAFKQYPFRSHGGKIMAMSFKCSVFGHAFGDAEIEREREEDGKEVVTTVREKETCKRCGETRVVSENKEVTTLETAADIVADDLDTDNGGEESTAPAGASDPAETVVDGDDAEVVEEAGDAEVVDGDDAEVIEESAETEGIDAENGEAAGEPAAAIPDAETGDAVAETDDAEPADPETDDGVILEEDERPARTGGRDPGEWPEEPDDDEDDWEPATEPEFDEEGTTIEQTGTAVTVPEGEFQCPECAFTTPVEESSLREGDFCPECHRGSLEHVPE